MCQLSKNPRSLKTPTALGIYLSMYRDNCTFTFNAWKLIHLNVCHFSIGTRKPDNQWVLISVRPKSGLKHMMETNTRLSLANRT
jgi:hypothetical protein